MIFLQLRPSNKDESGDTSQESADESEGGGGEEEAATDPTTDMKGATSIAQSWALSIKQREEVCSIILKVSSIII